MKKLILLSFLLSASLSHAVDVLVVGDSHMCGNFGVQLTKQLGKSGQSVRTYCAVSTSPVHWLKGKTPFKHVCQTRTPDSKTWSNCGGGTGPMATWASLMKTHNPRTVVIALGTNSLEGGSISADYARMADASRAAKVIWVGPPMLRPDQSRGWAPGRIQKLANNMSTIYASMKQELSRVVFIDSRPLTKRGTIAGESSDGVHRTDSAGTAWAQSLAEIIKKHL